MGKHTSTVPMPFRHNPRIAKRMAKLYRLKRKGMLPTKAELNELVATAVQSHPITRITQAHAKPEQPEQPEQGCSVVLMFP